MFYHIIAEGPECLVEEFFQDDGPIKIVNPQTVKKSNGYTMEFENAITEIITKDGVVFYKDILKHKCSTSLFCPECLFIHKDDDARCFGCGRSLIGLKYVGGLHMEWVDIGDKLPPKDTTVVLKLGNGEKTDGIRADDGYFVWLNSVGTAGDKIDPADIDQWNYLF
jgi:hypothetical protein